MYTAADALIDYTKHIAKTEKKLIWDTYGQVMGVARVIMLDSLLPPPFVNTPCLQKREVLYKRYRDKILNAEHKNKQINKPRKN